MPWSKTLDGERPEEQILRALCRRFTDAEIGRVYGVRRQTVAYWRETASSPIRRRGKHAAPMLSHKELLPWRVATEHSHDPWARAQRALSKERQGGWVRPEERGGLERLRRATDTGWLIAYERSRGFFLVAFNPSLDAEGAVIRAPRD